MNKMNKNCKQKQAIDPLEKFYRMPPMSNDIFNDQNAFTDADFFDILNLDYSPLKQVKDAVNADDLDTARAEIVNYFRTRKEPKVAKYRTDPHWSDWGDITVVKRADALCENKYYTKEGKALDFNGGPDEFGGIDMKKVLKKELTVPKNLHEFVRQGAMATLALAWSLTNSSAKKKRYSVALERWIRAFLAANPFVLIDDFHREEYGWFGGPTNRFLHVAYSIYSWGDILDSPLFRTPGALNDEFAFFFMKYFFFRMFNYTRLLGSKWRADNHHLMERGVCLYFIGVQFPEMKRAADVEEYAKHTIIKHFDYNVLPDNIGSEHCTAYNYRCLLRYAMPMSVARANGKTLLGKKREKRLVEWLRYNAYLTAPDGRLPDTGDGCAPTLHWIAEQSGSMLEDAVMKGVLESLKQNAPVNPHFQDAWDAVTPKLPQAMSKIYPYGGHIAMRDGWSPDSMYLHTAIKNKSLYNTHTHWNTYEFTIAANGKRLIGNPTSATYNMPRGVHRGYYFSMDAHNTLVIDDDTIKSHRALADKWGLQPTRIETAETSLNTGNIDYATFTHHGYLPLIHRRDVLFVKGRYIIMTDGITMDFSTVNSSYALEGDILPHTYRQRVHFETGVKAKPGIPADSVEAKDAQSKAGILIVPEPFENLKVDVGPNDYLKILDHPEFQGYMMADINRETTGAVMFSTIYRPFKGTAPTIKVTALTPKTTPYRNDKCHAIRIDDGVFTDIWFTRSNLKKTETFTIANEEVSLETNAASLFISMRNGKIVDSFSIGGKKTILNGKPIQTNSCRLTKHLGRMNRNEE